MLNTVKKTKAAALYEHWTRSKTYTLEEWEQLDQFYHFEREEVFPELPDDEKGQFFYFISEKNEKSVRVLYVYIKGKAVSPLYSLLTRPQSDFDCCYKIDEDQFFSYVYIKNKRIFSLTSCPRKLSQRHEKRLMKAFKISQFTELAKNDLRSSVKTTVFSIFHAQSWQWQSFFLVPLAFIFFILSLTMLNTLSELRSIRSVNKALKDAYSEQLEARGFSKNSMEQLNEQAYRHRLNDRVLELLSQISENWPPRLKIQAMNWDGERLRFDLQSLERDLLLTKIEELKKSIPLLEVSDVQSAQGKRFICRMEVLL